MSLKEDLYKGYFINLAGNFSRLFKPLFVFLIARLYSVEMFGIFSISLAIIEFFHSLSILGVEETCYKFIPEYRNDEKKIYLFIRKILSLSTLLSSLIALTLFLFSPVLFKYYFKSYVYNVNFLLLLPAIIFMTLSKALLAHTRALKIMEYNFITLDFIEPLNMIILLITFYFIPLTKKVAPFLALTTACGISVFIAFYFFSRHFNLKKCFLTSGKVPVPLETKKYLIYMSGIQIISTGLRKIDIIISGYFLDKFLVGIYSMSVEVSYVLGKLRSAANPIISPIFAELNSDKNSSDLSIKLKQSTFLAYSLSIPVLLIYIFEGKGLLNLFGLEYQSGYLALVILSCGHFVTNSLGYLIQFTAITGKPLYSILTVTMDIIWRIIFCFVLIPHYGIAGAAFATATSISLSKIPLLLRTSIKFKFTPFTRNQHILLLQALLTATLLWLLFDLLHIEKITLLRLILFSLVFSGFYFTLLKIFYRKIKYVN